jgi:mycothiol synthase
MGFTRFGELAPPEPVPGYGPRTFRPGDEDPWVEILSTGQFKAWDRDRLDRMLAGERAAVPLAGIYFATYDDRPIGTACTFLHPGEHGDVAELGWVAVHPLHRGQGLAMQVCRAVLGFVREQGHGYAYLVTEDFRLPAVKTYPRLGFVPELTDLSHPERWAAVRRALNAE